MMIFQQYRGHLLVVRQPDHGLQTGLFARRPRVCTSCPIIAPGGQYTIHVTMWTFYGAATCNGTDSGPNAGGGTRRLEAAS